MDFLNNCNKIVVFQRTPPNHDIKGNEKADPSGRRGTLGQKVDKPVPSESHKRNVCGKIIDSLKSKVVMYGRITKSVGKYFPTNSSMKLWQTFGGTQTTAWQIIG